MSLDIRHILSDWPYDPGQVSARRIKGDDGKDKIQLRLDLGLLQMDAEGHPAGQRPHGHESLLDYHEHLRDRRRLETGNDEGFSLDEQACEMLRNEGTMYYHRYLAEFIVEDYEAVVRDTMRNLRLMDFCGAYAGDESDRLALEQYRPYVIMMRTRAAGLLALRENRPKTALAGIKKGIAEIKDFYRSFGQEKLIDIGGELPVLEALAREIQERIPPDPIAKLRRELAAALKEEKYEEAAGIRDRLRKLSRGGQADGRE